MKIFFTLALVITPLLLSGCSFKGNNISPNITDSNVSVNPVISPNTTTTVATGEGVKISTITPSSLGDNFSVYTSDNLGIKFIFAKIDPLYKQNCSIVETENKVTNTCGLSIQIFSNNSKENIKDIVLSFVPDKNSCVIKSLKPLNNFSVGYSIETKPNFQKELSVCGKYLSAMGSRYGIYSSPAFPDRYIIVDDGGQDPSGVLKVNSDKSIILWTSTVEAISSSVQEGTVKIIQPTTEVKALDVDKTSKVYVNEEKKISINFIDGYEKYNDNMILFGPLGNTLESSVSDNRQIHIYQLEIVNYKSAKEIIKNYNITPTTTVKPIIVKIGNFEVVKYAEGGMCEERTLEIIGIKYNYRFSADGCRNNQETDFKYLTETIKQLEMLE
jgi:hypothetical protein